MHDLGFNTEKVNKLFQDSIEVKLKTAKYEAKTLVQMAVKAVSVIKSGGKIMLFGNGGSAADAQHIAAEMVVRLKSSIQREALPALSLAIDTSTITACANDIGYEHIYSRALEALGNQGDIAFGLSTSGNSPSIVNCLKAAKQKEIITFGFLGAGGGRCKVLCDYHLNVPSDNTARIQETHITAGHILIEIIEDQLIQEGFLNAI